MQTQRVTFGDRVQVIALAINIVVVVGLALWNARQEERLSKLEYEELAPRIAIYRVANFASPADIAWYDWLIRNNGRTAAENITVSVFSNSEFPFEDCSLGVPFDNANKRFSGNYIIFEGITLSPKGSISVTCSTKSGAVAAFMASHSVSPESFPSMNCIQQAAPYDQNFLYLLPNLGITANNVEPSRVYCVQELRDVYE